MTSITAAAPRTTDAAMYRRMSRLLLGAGAGQLIGGVMMLALGGEYASRTAATIFSIGWGVGWVLIGLALLSMTRTAVAGDRAGRLLPLIPSIGAASYVLAEIWWVANLTVGGRTAEAIEGDPVVFLLPAGALLGAVGMVVVGVAVVRARRWMGWRRFAPLLAGVYPIVAMFGFVAVTGSPNAPAVVGWSLPWLLFAAAAAAESEMLATRSGWRRGGS
jgi:hypothetical protein